MDISEQLTKSDLLLEERTCRVCGERKNLLDDFYKSRKNPALASSYSYECKVCTLKRINNYNKVNKKYTKIKMYFELLEIQASLKQEQSEYYFFVPKIIYLLL